MTGLEIHVKIQCDYIHNNRFHMCYSKCQNVRNYSVSYKKLHTYLITYLLTYLLTHSLTHSLHGAQSFLRS
jgi:hypothetical protein